MTIGSRLGAVFVAVTLIAACSHARAPARPQAVATPPPPPPPKLVVLLAESDRFPKLAKAATESLMQAKVDGLGAASGSKVSLEVVQLSIECLDSTVRCYEAAGRSLEAGAILFAQITVVKKRQLKVSITLVDADGKTLKAKAEKLYPTEEAATAGLPDLVAEATHR